MESGENNKKSTPKTEKQSEAENASSRWRFTEHVFAVIGAAASLIAVVGAIIVGVEHTSIFELHREEGMVSGLIPGDDYAKLSALIGAQPDFHQSLQSGNQIYVFDRRWEYVQLLVNETGTVLSVGIYAKTTEFKTTLVTGVILNGPPLSKQLAADNPIGANGSCGASWYYYYQGYSLPLAQNARSEIVGDLPVVDTNNKSIGTASACSVLISSMPCVTAYYKNFLAKSGQPALSSSLVSCMTSSKAGRAYLDELIPAIWIITAPSQPIIPDMLNYDYFATLAGT